MVATYVSYKKEYKIFSICEFLSFTVKKVGKKWMKFWLVTQIFAD